LDSNTLPIHSIQEEVEMALLALGYTEIEITQALTAVGLQTTLAKTGNIEDWIRETIAWLSERLT
jgi:Holliday junction DNA helicase RuvA